MDVDKLTGLGFARRLRRLEDHFPDFRNDGCIFDNGRHFHKFFT